jgi:hypothetical protein
MVRPTTDSATRSAASSFLDEWTRTPEAWSVYLQWLKSFHHTDSSNHETLGMQLLCLTLLVAKIRRELSRNLAEGNPDIRSIHNEVWSFLHNGVQSEQLVGPLSSCIAAMVVRSNQLADLIKNCSQTTSVSPPTALKLLASVPAELEACGDLTTPQVTAELWPHMEIVLDTVRRGLSAPETVTPSLEALHNWTFTCHITLSHLNSPTCGGTEALLPVMIRLLSQHTLPREELIVLASRALTEAILVPSDSCTPSRHEAVSLLLSAVPNGFVAAPLQYCTANEWDNASHALATLICTLVSDEVDDLSSQPADSYLGLLLQIQAHPQTRVALTVLECWLTVQDIPTSARHEHWKAPLFSKIAEGLVTRLAYTKNFCSWDQELDLDEQEFFEYRRMVTDVLANCYFLLRVEFLRQMVIVITTSVSNNDWTLTESALFCLGSVFREVCARIKANGSSTSLNTDRAETAQQLLLLLHQVCVGDPKVAAESAARQHPLVLSGVCRFMGLYAPAWNVHCNGEDIMQLLLYLQAALKIATVAEDASKAIRSIYISCSAHLADNSLIATYLRETMECVLLVDSVDSMSAVAEGSTRLIIQISGPQISESFNGILIPLVHHTDMALNAACNGDLSQKELALGVLSKFLRVLQIVIRFSDAPSGASLPIGEVLAPIWPSLEKVAQQCGENDSIISEVLSIKKQLLSNAPEMVAPRFNETVKFVVETYEKTKYPSTLDYLTAAVETFSNDGNEGSFKELLDHITTITASYVTTEKHPEECPQVIRAFFELAQRYVLFSPAALVNCREFGNIVGLAVECLTVCKGERESTRASSNFLTQLFGWKSLRLANEIMQKLEVSAPLIDDQLAKHGEKITSICIVGLGGGCPQMLWPTFSDCVISIVTHVTAINAVAPVVEENTVAHQWVYSSLMLCKTADGKALPAETCQNILKILFDLARQGSKAKPKAKMLLTDFALLCKGDLSVDSLLSYSLNAADVQR